MTAHEVVATQVFHGPKTTKSEAILGYGKMAKFSTQQCLLIVLSNVHAAVSLQT